MLTTSELNCIRDTVASVLTDTCDIYQRTTTADGEGGYAITYTLRSDGNDVACYVSPAASNAQQQEQLIAAGLQGRAAYFVNLPAGQACGIKDQIITNGRTLEVALQPYPTTNEIVRRVLCVWVESNG